jgi:hypothetical protein
MNENTNLAMFARNRRCALAERGAAARPVEARIVAFLDGESDGGELLHALYDHVLREPIPPSMQAILGEASFPANRA